jgi:hypothetical protein
VDCDAEVPDLFWGIKWEERGEEESGKAYALTNEDAESFAVYCVASSEDLVEHPRQRDLLVTLSAQGGREGSVSAYERA